jgi:exosortase A-associated hydrolase 2
MNPGGHGIVIAPDFVDGPRGRLFTVNLRPARTPFRCHVLFVPALADEQNKARHVVGAVARRLATQGLSVVLPDLYGTGDSEGEFAEVGWPDWVDDLEAGCVQLRVDADAPLVLWAMRGGALLASMLAARMQESVQRVVLWNPVLRGGQITSELARLRSASALLGGTAVSNAGGQYRADPPAGIPGIDVGGYHWSAELLTGLKQVDLVDTLPAATAVSWLEVVREPDRGPTPAVHKALESLRAAGNGVQYQAVSGVNFWNSVELEWPVALMDATVACLQSMSR